MYTGRRYGLAPYHVAVIHGGPGAPGSAAPIARELAADRGVLEPFQTAGSLEGQVEELRAVLATQAAPPVTLIGWSWGAMLSYITAARYPVLVQKLILVSSGVYEEHYAASILETRLSRLTADERRDVQTRLAMGGAALAHIGTLFKTRTDTYDALPSAASDHDGMVSVQDDIHQRVWADAQALRRSGALIALGKHIECPVIAIHGDYDPHPVEGVQVPLAGALRDFQFFLLDKCGHYPWLERHARDVFFQLLRQHGV